MKRILTSATTFCALSFSLFAHPQNGQRDDQYQSTTSASAHMTTPHKWQQCLIDKEGWIEGGAEWLFLSSSLSPVFTSGISLTLGDNSIPVAALSSTAGFDSIEQGRVDPDFNSGYALFFRYRGHSSDNDLSVHYHYLRNNGDGKINKRDLSTAIVRNVNNADVETAIGSMIDSKGYLRSHLHIFDLLASRALPLNYQMLLRLSGGFSVQDFFMLFQQNYNSTLNQEGEGVNSEAGILSFFRERVRFWCLGPKGQVAFDYIMLPSHWNHSFNVSLNIQYALLFTKQWSTGKVRVQSFVSDNVTPANDSLTVTAYDFRSQPDFHLIQNVNLDFGLNYRWESPYANMIFNLGAGYRIYSYWNLYQLFTNSRTLNNTNSDLLTKDQKMIYGGPYLRFSLAY